MPEIKNPLNNPPQPPQKLSEKEILYAFEHGSRAEMTQNVLNAVLANVVTEKIPQNGTVKITELLTQVDDGTFKTVNFPEMEISQAEHMIQGAIDAKISKDRSPIVYMRGKILYLDQTGKETKFTPFEYGTEVD